MNFHSSGTAGLIAIMVAACGGAQIAPVQTPSEVGVQRPPGRAPSAGVSAPAPMPAIAELHRMTRIIVKDPDGDGIANRRTIITEIFDEAGVLRESVREVDLEADGIFDSREVTSYEE